MLEVIHSDALTALRGLPDESVQCCVTSPPYFGLRSYGTDPVVWGGNADCEHEWFSKDWYRNGGGRASGGNFAKAGDKNAANIKESRWMVDSTCVACGAWRGELGLEPTPDLYVEHLVQIFREVRRVLRPDSTLWLNLSDSYAGSWGNYWPQTKDTKGMKERRDSWRRESYEGTEKTRPPTALRPHEAAAMGLKPKDLIGIPWRVALALQSDGWYLRSEITWCKQAPMPESVRDRPTSATEKIFLLSKSEKYFYNNEAVRERYADSTITRVSQPSFETQIGGDKDPHNGNRSVRKSLENLKARVDKQRGHSRRHAGFNDRWDSMSKEEQCAGGANLRNYWVLGPDCFPEAHFATFPREIPKRCILLGSKAGDTILDPFAGSGTTGKVAIELGRKAILIEPKAEYVEMINKRCQTTIGLPLTYGATTRRAGSGDNGS